MINKDNLPAYILLFIGGAVLVMGVVLLFIPPGLLPDPANGFQVLRSMHLGGGFNNMVAPDQSDISQDYTEFLTWWSPGQYLVPWVFTLITGLNLGKGIAITVLLSTASGLCGFYCFFRRMGFKPLVCALSLLFIFFQVAFFVPFVFYNGGEVLLYGFLGWFLYGCALIDKPGLKLILFVLLSGWAGFFCKSSFVWMYGAGLLCLWINLSNRSKGSWFKNAVWIGLPAMASVACIYLFFLSKGQSPASAAHGIGINADTFTFSLASPALSAFSVDDLAHGLVYHFGHPLIPDAVALVILLLLLVISVALIVLIARRVPGNSYRLFVLVFYAVAFAFFSYSYMRQLNISFEARHFRVLGILIIPGLIWLVLRSGVMAKAVFGLIWLGIAVFSVHYLVKGYQLNSNVSAHGVTGISQPNIDQPALDKVIDLDKQNKNAVFVFVSNDIGLEVLHNRVISLSPIVDGQKVDPEDYTYDGFSGPLYIVLPAGYKGAKEDLIMRSFPGYAGWRVSRISPGFTLYFSNQKAGVAASRL
jgi:hypothetical protein